MLRVIRWVPFFGFVCLFLGAVVWQNGGAALFQRLTGEVPWDSREETTAEAIDDLVAKVLPGLETDSRALEGFVVGDYVAWMIGSDAIEMLGPHHVITARDGGYVFTNLRRPARRPVWLSGMGDHAAQFAAHAESVVIIQAKPHETKLYPYIDSNDRPFTMLAENEQRATSYRLIVWVVEIASSRVTARTVIIPEPLPESFGIRDEDRQIKDVDGERKEIVHRRVKAYEDTFPRLTAWLENHHQSAEDG